MTKKDAARRPLNGDLYRPSNSSQFHTHSSPCLGVSVVNLMKEFPNS